jgi:hypothetical protein
MELKEKELKNLGIFKHRCEEPSTLISQALCSGYKDWRSTFQDFECYYKKFLGGIREKIKAFKLLFLNDRLGKIRFYWRNRRVIFMRYHLEKYVHRLDLN